jgi:glycosyltransferase 2 family protein
MAQRGMGMTKKRPRWLLSLLRYGLCVVAIGWLVTHVPWHTQVRLKDKDGPLVRLVEPRDPDLAAKASELVIEREGRIETIPITAAHLADVRGQKVLDIELGIPDVVRNIDGKLALVAILLFLPVSLIQSYRLVVMVAIQGVKLGYWNAIKLTFAGNFFNFALPGTTGGDLIKAYYLTQYTHLKTEVVTTVFLDRAIGLLGLVILAAGGILLTWDPDAFGSLALGLAVLCAILAAGSIVVFSGRIRRALRLAELAEKLPGGEQIMRIGKATVALRRHKGHAVVSLLLTLLLQIIVMISAAVMGWALGMHAPPGSPLAQLWYFVIYIAIGFLIAAIPITPPQGIGVMEAAYVKFFMRGGLNTASQAVALALAVRLIQLVWALPGVLVPLLGAHLPRKDELEAVEHGDEPPEPGSGVRNPDIAQTPAL